MGHRWSERFDPVGLSELEPACADELVILGWLEGTLDAEARSNVDDHLDECDACRTLVAHLADEAITPMSVAGRAPAAAPVRVGDAIGRYEIVEWLGSGGMGVVYAAYDPELNRRVALKLYKPGERQEVRARELEARLIREARAMARVAHPNVITVFDVGTIDGAVFVAMELVEGETLASWLRAEARSLAEVLRVFVDAGRGLDAAHRAGLVHRDFKPENVLIGRDGRVKVTDFGLARPLGEDEIGRLSRARIPVTPSAPFAPTSPIEWRRRKDSGFRTRITPLTQTGSVLGTPAYMAPEQARGRATALADQFSFAVSLFVALSGTSPFPFEDGVLDYGPITWPKEAQEQWPDALTRLFSRALALRERERFSDMRELLDWLDAGVLRHVDTDVGERLRAKIGLGLFALFALTPVMAYLVCGSEALSTVGGTLAWSLTDCLGIFAVVVAFWRYLRSSSYNRRLVAIVSLGLVARLASLATVVLDGASVAAAHTTYLLGRALIVLMAAVTFERRIWPSAVVFMLAYVAAAWMPETRFVGVALSDVFVVSNFVWIWRRRLRSIGVERVWGARGSRGIHEENHRV